MAARAALRARWRSVLVIGLVIGLAGGVVLTAFAGARRTRSTYDRFRTETAAAEITATIFPVSKKFAAEIGAVRGVESWAQLTNWAAIVLNTQWRPIAAAVDRRFGRDVDRARLIAGRPARGAHEIVLSASAATSLHLGVGDVLHLATSTPHQTELIRNSSTDVRPQPDGPKLALRIVGIDQRAPELTPIGEKAGIIFLPRAVYRAYRGRVGDFGGLVRIRLEPGARTGDVIRRIREIAGDRSVDFDTGSLDDGGVNDSLNVLAVGLLLFGVIGALGAIATIAVLSARSSAGSLSAQREWHTLGLTRRQRLAAVLLPLLPGALGGTLLAVLIAAAASWFMPIGLGRRIEPTPGFDLDPIVLVLGGAAILTATAIIGLLNAWRVSRRSSWDPTQPHVKIHTSRSARLLTAAAAPTPAVIGVQMALEPGRGRTAVPVRPAIIGAVLGVLGLVAALVVGASLDRAAHDPARYGWNFDAVLIGGGGETAAANTNACGPRRSVLASDRPIAAMASICSITVVIGGRPTAAFGFRPIRGSITPTVLRGRLPRTDHEIALGEKTLDRLGAHIGDHIDARGNRAKVSSRIVGTALFPSLDDPVTVADGAILLPKVLTRIATAKDSSFSHLVVRWRSGTNVEREVRRITRVTGQPPNRPQPPAELNRMLQLNRLPDILAAFLALLAIVAVGHAIVTNARRRRRDLALLATLGFRPRDVRATVSIQATTLAILGLVLGIPSGLIVGRMAWGLIARQVGIAGDAAIPAVGLAALVPLTILVTLIVAFVPARAASRIRPAPALRSE